MNKKLLIGVSAIGMLALFIAASFFFKSSEETRISKIAKENLTTFVRDHAPVFGAKNPEVYLVEFLDPECGTCSQFYPIVKNIIKKHEGKIQLVVRYAPFHPNSKFAIKILEAARMQGKYWETLEFLFYKQSEWSGHQNPQPEKVWDYLPMLGLDVEKIKRDMNSEIIMKNLDQDIKDGAELNVRQTPGFFINGKPLTSFGEKQLINAIESALQ